jgi:hypothetical protein
MPKKLKIFVFIDHHVVIRSFIQSGALRPLLEKHEVQFFFPEEGYKNDQRMQVDLKTLGLGDRIRHLTVAQNRMILWTKYYHVSCIRWRPWVRGAAELRYNSLEFIGPGHRREYWFLSLPLIFWWFRRRTIRETSKILNKDLETLLDREQPDLLLHPTTLWGPYTYDLIEASKRRGIPLTAITKSWDNAMKGLFMIDFPTWLLVWGEQSWRYCTGKRGMPPDRVVKFGAAQFDVYRDRPLKTKEQFRAIYDIDVGKTVLLYAGASKDTDEFAHLKILDDAVESGILKDTAIVYRPHPWGAGGIDGGRIIEHPWRHVRIDHTMRAYLEQVRSEGYVSTLPDYRNTRDLLSWIDATISPLSTLLVESAVNGKPAMIYAPTDETESLHYRMVKNLVLFQDIFHMPEFLVATNRRELVEKSMELIERTRNPLTPDRMRKAVSFIVEPHSESYGERLVEFVESAVPQ